MLHLLRDLIKDTLLRIEDEKKHHPAGLKPMTSLLPGVCSTPELQLLPNKVKT
jgi:hypothetical protein